MKKTVMVLAILSYAGQIVSQTRMPLPLPIQRFEFGFNIGLNYSNAFVSNTSTLSTNVHNGPGFRIGLVMNNEVNSRIRFSSKSELSFNDCYIKYSDGFGISTYTVYQVVMEFMSHICYSLKPGGTEPYVLAGPNVKVPLEDHYVPKIVYGNNTDIAIDLGVGFRKPLKYFYLSPEFRYSIGLRDISKAPELKKVYFHTLTLVFNFSG